MKQTFEEWWVEFNSLIDAQQLRTIYGRAEHIDKEHFKGFWEDGYSAKDTLEEDLSYL